MRLTHCTHQLRQRKRRNTQRQVVSIVTTNSKINDKKHQFVVVVIVVVVVVQVGTNQNKKEKEKKVSVLIS